MRRLLALAPTPNSAASTRFRLTQFFPALRAAGIEPTLRPFLDEAGWQLLYQPGQSIAKFFAGAKAVLERASDLVRTLAADAVLIHREAALVGPPILEFAIAQLLARPIVFDIDDAVWEGYVSPTYGALLSRLLKAPHKANYTLAHARAVIAGNAYLANYARNLGDAVTIIPTVVDTDLFAPRPAQNARPVIGWIGTHSTVQYLAAIAPALRRLREKIPFTLRVIGGTLDVPGLEIEHRQWRLQSEVADFQSLDIGLYPLVEDRWALGKSGFKAVQYMSVGVPVVASPVGVTTDMVRDGENGFLARNENEWVEKLGALLESKKLRTEIGERGRADAIANWSLQKHAPRFVTVIEQAMANAC